MNLIIKILWKVVYDKFKIVQCIELNYYIPSLEKYNEDNNIKFEI